MWVTFPFIGYKLLLQTKKLLIMKIVKIGILALSLGFFMASCGNGQNSSSTTDSTSTMTTTPDTATAPPASATPDTTMNNGAMNNGSNNMNNGGTNTTADTTMRR